MKGLLRKIIIIICVITLCYSIFQIGKILYTYYQIDKTDDALISEMVIASENDENDPLKRKIDFDKLLERNPDVVGWLYIPGTNIDEPILKGDSSETYLRHDIDHKYSIGGQLFIDNNARELNDAHTIVYGHNMRNGSKFHDLRYYFNKQGFFEENQRFYIYLPDQTVNIYDIFSVNKVKADSDLYQTYIDYSEYVELVRKNSTYFREPEVEESPILTLSTCAGLNTIWRFTITSRLTETVAI